MLARMIPSQLGPYLIGEILGKGGMGSVYRGTHHKTGDAVAVKVLNPQLAISEGFRDRFEGEIESLQTLRHAGIVRLFGYGEEEGVLFYAMELVNGPSLEQELRNGRRFNWRETALIGIQVSRALKHAHDHGVIHRDIKPANILLGKKGLAKIADFGIARLFGSNSMTISGGVLGTADYMSPEQAAGKPVTARCDQYSLGGVMYALLAGRPPFRADDLPAMLQLQRFAIQDPVTRYAPDTPRQMELVIGQLLEKEPTKRFPNTMVLAKHLEAMTRALAQPAEDDFDIYDPGAPVQSHDALSEASNNATLGPTQVAPITERPDSPKILLGDLAGKQNQDESQNEDETGTTPSASFINKSGDLSEEEFDLQPVSSSYTTVSYEAEAKVNAWRPLLSQLLVLLIPLTLLGGLTWWWMKPLSADQLYRRISIAQEEESTDRRAQSTISEFQERFPQDLRQEEVLEWNESLELRLLKNRLAVGRLRTTRRGEAVSPEEILYQRASELAKSDHAAGAAAFRELSLLLKGAASSEDDQKQRSIYAQLAQREAERLGRIVAQEEKQLIAFGKERLKVARNMRLSNPKEARQIVHAILELMPRSKATAPMLRQAKELLNQF